MKVDKLINQLQKIREEHGNINIYRRYAYIDGFTGRLEYTKEPMKKMFKVAKNNKKTILLLDCDWIDSIV